MGKITFRADDELVDALESFETSKSEVMRRALRQYLETRPDAIENAPLDTGQPADSAPESLDELLQERIDAIVEDRIDARLGGRMTPQDLNVNITLDGATAQLDEENAPQRMTADDAQPRSSDETRDACDQCGEPVDADHVHCPNCGEKVSHRIFCDCGDELRSDWAFCPSCGRRTPAADVLDST